MRRGIIIFLTLLFAVSVFASETLAKPLDIMDLNGPKMKDLYYVIIRDIDAQVLAMSTGKLDVLSEIIRPSDVKRLSESGVADISLASTFHVFLSPSTS